MGSIMYYDRVEIYYYYSLKFVFRCTLFYVYEVFFNCMYGCALCTCLVPTEGRRGHLDFLELELRVVVNHHHVGDGTQTQVLCEINRSS